MIIKQANKINEYSACTGDLILTEDQNGVKQYLLFCETGASANVDSEGFSNFYFVNIEEGYMFEQELHNDDEIKIGFKIDGCGIVKKIIPNNNIELLLNDSL